MRTHQKLQNARTLDRRHLVPRQLEIEDAEVLGHVPFVRRARERDHADLQREPEDDLLPRLAEARGRGRDGAAAGRDVAVRRQEREALVDDAVLAADPADLVVPARAREAAVLDDLRRIRKRARSS